MTDDSTQSGGKWMYILAWVAALGLMTTAFNEYIKKQENPNSAPESVTLNNQTEVRLKQNRQGHYVSSGTINGVDVVFMVDTGATDVSIPAHLADQLGLSPGFRHRVSTANGTIVVAQTSISSLTVGDIELHQIDANLNPGMQDDQILLGMSALRHLEFTQRGDWLILRTL